MRWMASRCSGNDKEREKEREGGDVYAEILSTSRYFVSTVSAPSCTAIAISLCFAECEMVGQKEPEGIAGKNAV